MKKTSISWFIPFLIVVIFLLQYILIISYLEKMFKYTNECVLNEVLNEEKQSYNLYIVQKGIILFLQFIGSIICLNIGFLYFNYKIPIKNVFKLVLKSFTALIIVQLLVIGIIKFSNMTFTVGTINYVEEKLSIVHYLNIDLVARWLILPLQTINLTQLFIIPFLTF